jgi:hypothetical protein
MLVRLVIWFVNCCYRCLSRCYTAAGKSLIETIIYVIGIIQKLVLTSICGFRNVSTAELHNCEDSLQACMCDAQFGTVGNNI